MTLSTEASEESTRQTEAPGMTAQMRDAATSSNSFGGSSWGVGDSVDGSQVLVYRPIKHSGVILMAMMEPQARLSTRESVNPGPSRLSTIMSRGSNLGTIRGEIRGKGWWLFRGMVNDIRRRAPFYMSDWTDAWDYRVVPSTSKGNSTGMDCIGTNILGGTVYMFFAKCV